MCKTCNWKKAVEDLDKLIKKNKKKDFIAGYTIALKQRIKREKHCTSNQWAVIAGLSVKKTKKKVKAR